MFYPCSHLPFLTYSHILQKGSVLAAPDSLNDEGRGSFYVVEGIGYDFIPDVLCRDDIDVWVKTSDEEAFEEARRLMRLEGLLIGGSSGSALAGALKWLRSSGKEIAETEGANVVILLPDGQVSFVGNLCIGHSLTTLMNAGSETI